ncbi:phosphatidylethanolamine-binding protein [Talaromyces proteolyticus]|uniref:Phosphatidylethanolamine-binding protein n=1 Tax=Talaromyces proteolyticus TaxID=1131652 RepID=A0AAD4KGM5_9EURO|nr:phosphatidylethanolamine-binding protein [Talaromyces proteolyticus]KAH8690680.1 phosphatidylethanolamine-binding protein [Talaromyces proteolyticus]
MLPQFILQLFLVSVFVRGETPPGFEPSIEDRLGVTFSDELRVHPGDRISKDETKEPPRLDLNPLPDNPPPLLKYYHTKYIVLMIDLDVPHNDTILPFSLSPGHSSKSNQAEYMAPSPPQGPAHRYVELLFEQPKKYHFPKNFKCHLPKRSEARLGFDVEEFAKEAGMDRLVAGNWFLVQTGRGEREDL